ncbi:DUF3592 domain-containing protein [Maribacter forsetii]|uniref:DUF3592 domain-containing protein n=1 Tax=Maribacter forsetii TaxID=444515 RepID=UPI0005660545|nr:DUF3592 domain-containing protein [Maribacter forsetii]
MGFRFDTRKEKTKPKDLAKNCGAKGIAYLHLTLKIALPLAIIMQLLTKIAYVFGISLILLFLLLQVIFSFYNLKKPLVLILENEKFNWEQTVAQIKSVKLESSPNPNMPKEASMVFPIEECKIKYVYKFNGKDYTNSKIGLNKEKEYESKFHRGLYLKLKEMNNVVIYVNPKNPNESSIIKYDINLKDIGAGIALLIFPLFVIHWVYISKKYPSNYLADKINIIS